jgi:hypothetical protein
LDACPDGRLLAGEPLNSVIWQGRNQALHWEEGSFKPQVVACFAKLEAAFGPRFSLTGASSNLAKDVLDLLGWIDHPTYAADMQTLIG